MASSSLNEPVLVVGGDGLIGGALVRHLQAAGIPVLSSTRRPEAASPGRPLIDLAAGIWPDFRRADAPPVRKAVICAAVARLGDCARDPAGARRANVHGTVALVRDLAEAGIAPLFLSTDKVFDGSVPRRRAGDPPCPCTEYGRQKAEAEAAVMALPGAGILRLAKVIHPGMALFNDWIRDLREGVPISPFADMTLAPAPVSLVVQALQRLLERDFSGIWQLSARDDASYFDVALLFAQALKVSADLVRPGRGLAEAAIGGEPLSAWTSLDGSRLEQLCGLRQPTVREAVVAILPPAP